MANGFVYITAVVAVASRRVLAHKTATTLEAHHPVETPNPTYLDSPERQAIDRPPRALLA